MIIQISFRKAVSLIWEGQNFWPRSGALPSFYAFCGIFVSAVSSFFSLLSGQLGQSTSHGPHTEVDEASAPRPKHCLHADIAGTGFIIDFEESIGTEVPC